MAFERLLLSLPFLAFGALGLALFVQTRASASPTLLSTVAIRASAMFLAVAAGVFGLGAVGYGIVYVVWGPAQSFGHHLLEYFYGVLGSAALGLLLGLVGGWKLGRMSSASRVALAWQTALQVAASLSGVFYAWAFWD